MDTTAQSYDELPYPNLVFPQTHPNRIAAIASLFGVATKVPGRSRILELGCGTGSNLIAMAVELPEATLVGVDFSRRQIETGNARIAAAGIGNVTLRHADLADISSDWGQFDYIIAHGVYSWVPEAVQKKILEICRTQLAPEGIAYISYNCYPGWHMRTILRDMMAFRTNGTEGALPRVRQAREVLDFMAGNATQGTPFASFLSGEAALLRAAEDGYVFHEYLERHNAPVYFHQFAAQAGQAGLQYLGDASPQTLSDGALSAEAVETLSRMGNGDVLQTEQYLDFLRNRSFRESLLVHREIPLQRQFDLQALQALYFAAPVAAIAGDFDASTSDTVDFSLPDGSRFAVSNMLVKALLKTFANRWPRSATYAELTQDIEAQLQGAPSVAQGEELSRYLLAGFLHGTIEMTVAPWRCGTLGEKNPSVSILARQQAQDNLPIVDLRHRIIQDSPGLRLILPYLDGQRSITEIGTLILQRVLSGEVQISREGQRVIAPEALQQLISEDLATFLKQVQGLSLLLAGTD